MLRMGDFAQQFFFALLAFILGLITNRIGAIWGRERQQVTYSTTKQPIISVTQDLPSDVLRSLPTMGTNNVVRWRLAARNTGTLPVETVNFLAVANDETPSQQTQLLYKEINTDPPREVTI